MWIERTKSTFCGFGILFLFVWAVQLLSQSPCSGVADINDFWRVMRPAGIEHIEPLSKPGYFVVQTFKTQPPDIASAPSSSALLALAARSSGWGLTKARGQLDLRQMGRVQLILMALILGGALVGRVSPWVVMAFLFVLVDPGYLLFFNSFYADSALFLGLVGVSLWLLRAGDLGSWFWTMSRARLWLVSGLLFVMTFLGGASKMQYILFSVVLLMAMSGPLVASVRRFPLRVGMLALGLGILSGAIAWNFFFGPGPRFLKFNNYHAVYGGILRASTHPERVLEQLGVPKECWDLPRTDVWSGGVPNNHRVHKALQGLSRVDLLRLYLEDPRAVLGIARRIEATLASIESHPRGTGVEEVNGGKKFVFTTWWQFSKWRAAVFGVWPSLVWLILAGSFGWVAIAAWFGQWDATKTTILFLLLWITSQLSVTVLGEGLINLLQHLVGARLGLDLLLVVLVYDVVNSTHQKLKTSTNLKGQ